MVIFIPTISQAEERYRNKLFTKSVPDGNVAVIIGPGVRVSRLTPQKDRGDF